MISIIAAVSNNGVIGVDNKLPWDLPEDLKRFKELTTGNVVIMGRKTYESIGKPLPNRINIVITRNKDFFAPDVIVTNSLESALLKAGGDKDIFIIGGGEIYKQSMNFVDKLYITEVDMGVEGDTTFPTIDKNRWSVKEDLDFDGGKFLLYEINKVLTI
jgi:dihydrofolate reductase